MKLLQENSTYVGLPDYVVVFRGAPPPEECPFPAIADQHARELMEQQYPRYDWTLYRIDESDQRQRVCEHHAQAEEHGADGSPA